MNKINTNYGKLVNSQIEYAKMPICTAEGYFYTNDENKFYEAGFSKIELTDEPEQEGYYFTPEWEQVDDRTISRIWVPHIEPPVESSIPEPIDLTERIEDLENAICELANLINSSIE